VLPSSPFLYRSSILYRAEMRQLMLRDSRESPNF
jgi:hypothetical protein